MKRRTFCRRINDIKSINGLKKCKMCPVYRDFKIFMKIAQ